MDERTARKVRNAIRSRSRIFISFYFVAVTKMISAAKNGSMSDLEKLPAMFPLLSPDLLAEAIAPFCTILDVPSFDPEMPLPSSLTQCRPHAFTALASIASIPDLNVVDPEAAVHGVIQRSWPQILNWMKYFYQEFTTASPKPDAYDRVIRMIAAVISKVERNKAFFKRAVLNDNLFNLIIRVWLKSGDSPWMDAVHH